MWHFLRSSKVNHCFEEPLIGVSCSRSITGRKSQLSTRFSEAEKPTKGNKMQKRDLVDRAMIRHQADNDRLVCIFRRNCPNHANISFSNIAVDIIQNRTRFHILGIYYEKYKSIYRISYLEKIISATIELTTHSLSQHLSQHSL